MQELIENYKSTKFKYTLEIDNLILNIFNKSYAITYSDKDEYVYVFFNKHTNLYKIGITKNVRERYMMLSNQSGCWLDIINYYEIDGYPFGCVSSRHKEKFLHDFFNDKRIIGEWFELNQKDLNFINYFFDLCY